MQVLRSAQIYLFNCFGFGQNEHNYDVKSKFLIRGFFLEGDFVRQALLGIVPRGCVTHIGDPGCQMHHGAWHRRAFPWLLLFFQISYDKHVAQAV